jgi:hypothetical protein
MSARPGRSCPIHYRYAPTVFATPAEVSCEVLYVVGGLYGNEFALNAVFAAFEAEAGAKHLVFNGDFNWLNVHPELFQRLNEWVLCWHATRGNVETELGAEGSEAGCGCAYPDWVDEGVVERSNAIMRRLRRTAAGFPAMQAQLTALPMWQRIDVGATRVAVVHGDAESLAGWGFAQESLKEASHLGQVRHWFTQAQVDVFASSHTCLPIFQRLAVHGHTKIIANNGAARGCPTSLALSMACSRALLHALTRAHSAVLGRKPLACASMPSPFITINPPGNSAFSSNGLGAVTRTRHTGSAFVTGHSIL